MDEAVARTRAPAAPPALHRRVFPLKVEMGVVALVLLLWQAVRIPLEGSTSIALAHARSWLDAERALHIDVEASLIRFVHAHGDAFSGLVDWAYENVHLPVLVAFMAAVRLAAPLRYPNVRTAFVAAHLPALVIIGLYPLAPPEWLSSLPFTSGPPTHAEMTTLGETLRNATAAAASLHFGYPLLIAGTALWLAPRRPLVGLALLYVPLVFFVIVGSANHYVLDAAIGAACMAFGVAVAQLLHGPLPEKGPSAPPSRILAVFAVSALVGYLVNAALTGQLT